VHSAHEWRDVLEPVVAHCRDRLLRRYFRGDAAFALPKGGHWSLTTLRERLIKIEAKVAVSKTLFQKILALIDDPRQSPVSA